MLSALCTGLYAWEIARKRLQFRFIISILLCITACRSLSDDNSFSSNHLSSFHKPVHTVHTTGLKSNVSHGLRSYRGQYAGDISPKTSIYSFNVEFVSKSCVYAELKAPQRTTNEAVHLSIHKMDARGLTTCPSTDESAGLQSAVGNRNVPCLSDADLQQNPFTSQHKSERSMDRNLLYNSNTLLTSAKEDKAISRITYQVQAALSKTATINTQTVQSHHHSEHQSSTGVVYHSSSLVPDKMFNSVVRLEPSPDMQKIFGSFTWTSKAARQSSIVSHKKFSGSVSSLMSDLHVKGAPLMSDALSLREVRSKTFLSHYSSGFISQARRASDMSSSTVRYVPRISPSYTSTSFQLFARSTNTQHGFSSKGDIRSFFVTAGHAVLSSPVYSSVSASVKTSLVCSINEKNCTCFNCDEARRRGEAMTCCVDLIDPKMLQHGALLGLVNITVQKFFDLLLTASRVIAEVIWDWCQTKACINTGFDARRKRRSPVLSNETVSSESAIFSSEHDTSYHENSYSLIGQTSPRKSLKRSTSVNKEALRPEVDHYNKNISNVNTIIYRISPEVADRQTLQTAFYVTMTTVISNGTNLTQVLDGNVLLQILRDKRQTLENRLNITIVSILAWQAASKKEATTNLQLLQDPTPGSGTYQSSPATSTGG